MSFVANVLAERYASPALRAIWSPESRIILERQLWIAVMKGQRELGLDIPEDAIAAYEAAAGKVDLASIQKREARTRHDVKARIEEFCELAGHQHIHMGMTSRDLTENVEQLQIHRSLHLVLGKAVTALNRLAGRARETRGLLLTARTHNVPAQHSTFGRRLAMFGEEFVLALERLEKLVEGYPVRGLKGAVGTQLDILRLFDGDAGRARQLEERVLVHLGVRRALEATGQVYPRSLDYEVVSALYQLGSGPASFAKTLRLMAGHELASEGFAPGQTGSSAMPHKMNSRSCERLNGLHVILRGHETMAASLAGDQWNEGDVSCSVVRRVLLPDSFFAIDGLLETFLAILRQMQVNPAVLERENRHNLPFLLTTAVLMEAVRAGMGREEAHALIKEHALATVHTQRQDLSGHNDLFERIAADERIPLGNGELAALMEAGRLETGAALSQTDAFLERAGTWRQRFPQAADYQGGDIL